MINTDFMILVPDPFVSSAGSKLMDFDRMGQLLPLDCVFFLVTALGQ